jgi:hypothetical protein
MGKVIDFPVPRRPPPPVRHVEEAPAYERLRNLMQEAIQEHLRDIARNPDPRD